MEEIEIALEQENNEEQQIQLTGEEKYIVPTIGDNGNWIIANEDTGKPSQGPKGEDGQDGEDGKDGVSVTHSWDGTILTITSASGTSSSDLKGERGQDGKDGQDGSVKFNVVNELPTEDIDESAIYLKQSINGATWDGDTTGREVVTLSDYEGMTMYKVSDLTPTAEELVGKTIVINDGEATEEYVLTTNDIREENGMITALFYAYMPVVLVVSESTTYSTGTYFLYLNEEPYYNYTSALYLGEVEENNSYQEYIYVNGAWESIGGASAKVDMSNYYTKEEIDSTIGDIETLLGGI